MGFEDFLQKLVDFINAVRTQKPTEVYQEYAVQITEYYYSHEDVVGRLQEAVGTDVELYALFLFTLQFIVQDPKCVYELQQLPLRDDFELFAAIDVSFQVASLAFRDDNVHLPYSSQRKVFEHLLERVETELIGEVDFLPYGQRNKKRIVLATDALLELYHAPTKLVFTMADYLNKLGYEVIIVVNVWKQPRERGEQYCFAPFRPNYNKGLGSCSDVEYHSNEYTIYQIFFGEGEMEQQRQMLKRIYDWKPLFVWYIGGSLPVGNIYRRVVTELSMGCTDGYLCSCAPVLLSYMQSNSDDVRESIAYASSHGQKLYNIRIASKYDRSNLTLTRKDLGIPERSFVLSVVGNRLDDEISLEFVKMLRKLAGHSEIFHIVLVGECSEGVLEGIDRERYTCLGFRKDLVDVLAMTDLFVNPPRQGGGGGAARAFAVGVPVVTYPDCDVSNVTGPDFCCQSLEEMRGLIERYANDSDFYKKQQERVRQINKEREETSDHAADEVGRMIEQVTSWLESGEID